MAIDFSESGKVVQGPEASTRPGATTIPEMPRCDFYLMHHPENWELRARPDGDYEWLPRLKLLFLQPGINGVRQVRGGMDDSAARISFQDRGWTILDRKLGYVTKYPCRRGQSSYLTWDTPHVMGRKVIVRHDADGYADWRRTLLENGTIQTPEPEALEAILHELDKRIERAGKAIHIPGVRVQVEKDEKKRAAGKKAAKKATTRKRAPRKKAAPHA